MGRCIAGVSGSGACVLCRGDFDRRLSQFNRAARLKAQSAGNGLPAPQRSRTHLELHWAESVPRHRGLKPNEERHATKNREERSHSDKQNRLQASGGKRNRQREWKMLGQDIRESEDEAGDTHKKQHNTEQDGEDLRAASGITPLGLVARFFGLRWKFIQNSEADVMGRRAEQKGKVLRSRRADSGNVSRCPKLPAHFEERPEITERAARRLDFERVGGSLAKIKLTDTIRPLIPYTLILVGDLVVIAFWPWLILFLPALFKV